MIRGLDFVMIPTTDMDRAIAFYRDTLGLEQTMRWENSWAEFNLGGNTLAVMDPTAAGMPFEPIKIGGVALYVEDVAAAVAAIRAKGYPLEDQIIDTGVCHMHMFRDPDGNALMLHNRYAPEEER